MFKMFPVGQLKEGDRFKFANDIPRKVDGGGNEAQGDLLQVTRTAQVNAAAGSCYFRYRPAHDAAGFSQSWNGVADVQVQLEVQGVEEPILSIAVDSTEAPAARKRRPAVKLVKQTTIAPPKKATKTAPAKAELAAKAKPTAKNKAGAKGKKAAVAKAEPAKTAKPVKAKNRLVLRTSTPTVSKSSAAEHSTLHEKRPSMTPQLSKPTQKKSRRA